MSKDEVPVAARPVGSTPPNASSEACDSEEKGLNGFVEEGAPIIKASLAARTASEDSPEGGSVEQNGVRMESEIVEAIRCEVRAGFEAITALIGEVNESVREVSGLAERRESIVDRLHQEVVSLRSGELQQAMMPVLKDLVRLYDDLDRKTAIYLKMDGAGAEFARDCRIFRDTVTDVLYRHGVEPFIAEVGERFDARSHRVLAAVPIDDAERDQTIFNVVRIGFKNETRVVRMMEVEVYRHTPAPAKGAEVSPQNPAS